MAVNRSGFLCCPSCALLPPSCLNRVSIALSTTALGAVGISYFIVFAGFNPLAAALAFGVLL